MFASEPGLLRIEVVEAYGLASRAGSVRVSVKLDGELIGRSPPVAPTPSARWDFQLEIRVPGQPAQLFFEVTRPGLLRCTTVSMGGFTLPVDASTDVSMQTFPLWDYQRQTVGSLLVSIQPPRSNASLQGGLANRASPPFSSGVASSESDAAALLEPRPVQKLNSRIASASTVELPGLGGLANHVGGAPAAQPALPGALSNYASASASLDNQASPDLSHSLTRGLQNQAVEDESGTRPNALPRTKDLLDGLSLFSPEDQSQCQSLGQAVAELRHVPERDLKTEDGEAALEMCGVHIEKLFRHALGAKDEEAAGRAIWLAGRLPQSNDDDDDDDSSETLQVRLRRDFHRHQMEVALDQADNLIPEAQNTREALWRLMDNLDLAGSHAPLAKSDTSLRVKSILSELEPHISGQLQSLLRAGELEEVEGILNMIGAGRTEAMGLHSVASRLEVLKGVDLLQSALTPAPGQIGFPMLKQRVLRHATMTARTALAGDASEETAGRLRRLLLQELLPVCLEHSCESTLAALQTALDLLAAADEVWAAARAPYERLGGERKEELAARLPGACRDWRVRQPEWLLSAEQAQCQQALREALGGSDPGALQAALVMVKEAQGGRDVCAGEFEEALERLRSQHRLPEGWNVESMLAGQAERKLLAREELTDRRVIRAFDNLLKASTNPVWTRDRKGRVTKGFEAVRVVHVMNAATWAGYVQRRDEIVGECSRLRCRSDDTHWQNDLNGVPMTKQPFEAITSLLSAPPLVERANELWLLHGTSHAGAAAISSDDFDMARARPTGLYGAGIYLAESVSKSDEYVQGDASSGVELFPILLCRVCLGNVYYCAEKLPDRRNLEDRCLRQQWHSVLGDRKKTSGTFREFIIYDPNQVFPGYIVYYKRTA
mmetsp:Transcript_101147/g.294528  ORF Transcript_101147/g.294528 Transcript_101147/m.294528 type:complete len:893 (-) Transcript_101147:11-2689(-)